MQKLAVYTASEAARELGVTATTIYRWLNGGTLAEVGTLKGRTRLVDADSVAGLKRKRERAAAVLEVSRWSLDSD